MCGKAAHVNVRLLERELVLVGEVHERAVLLDDQGRSARVHLQLEEADDAVLPRVVAEVLAQVLELVGAALQRLDEGRGVTMYS